MTAPFCADVLSDALRSIGAAAQPQFVCAVSGGADSLALMHALACLDVPARAVYVDHGLHADSALWWQSVEAAAAACDTPATCLRIELAAGGNVEARARDGRYAALAANLVAGEVLLTAHHQEDQALTLLLQLLRGAGVDGLAAMPWRTRLGHGEHWRPLLDVPEHALLEYCAANGLAPVSDPSNDDLRFDRSYLAHRVVPVLAQRWPAYARTLARSARHCAEASQLLARREASTDVSDSVRIVADPAALANALRQILRRMDIAPPSTRRLQEFVRQIVAAAPDAQPHLVVTGATLRRYRDRVYVDLDSPGPAAATLALPPNREVELGGVAGTVCWQTPDETSALSVRFRRGGERFGRAPSYTLKTWLQDNGVLPWRRGDVPLIYDGDTIIAVGDRWQASTLAGQVVWRPRATMFEAEN